MQTAEGIAVICKSQKSNIEFDHYGRSPVCWGLKSTEQSPGVVLRSRSLEAQQKVPFEHISYLSYKEHFVSKPDDCLPSTSSSCLVKNGINCNNEKHHL